MNLFKLTL